jgi:hypothetical protein
LHLVGRPRRDVALQPGRERARGKQGGVFAAFTTAFSVSGSSDAASIMSATGCGRSAACAIEATSVRGAAAMREIHLLIAASGSSTAERPITAPRINPSFVQLSL